MSDRPVPTRTADADERAHTAATSPNLELVQAAYRAFHRRDTEALLDVLAPDVRWIHPDSMSEYSLGGTRHGHAGVRSFLSHVPTVVKAMRIEPREFLESGDRVVVFGVRQVTSTRGTTEELKFVHSWTLRDGKATVMEDIFDSAPFRRVIEN
ncbi:nuclear transport factor 2 family protein [Streptomyces sp. PTY087I2]|uniref:nuclear transport factor 2 family protein n=1 Tax=Streptomyces sp. PTY087I2 TaxID=1819298 RepID=UPI00099F68B9|nr:nuclear transport factor 2 family protein [Streptomyces sp. PTY087I2]